MKRAALAPLALFLVACGGDDSAETNAESPDDGGLVNVAGSVEEVLEHGALIGACETYFAAPGDATRREMLLCGKEMFFYEGFDIPGAPTVIAEFFGRLDSVEDWTAFGMIRDPYGADGLALGLVDGAPLGGESPTVTFGCASCHFGQSADGRYVVGHPNQRYDYGGQTLALTMGPGLAIGIDTPDDHHEAAVARLQPILDELRAKPELQSELLQQLLPLADAAPDGPVISVEQEGFYASWKPGTQDPIMDPVGSDDNVHVALKIPTLFDLPRREEVAAAGGVDSSMIGWTGNVPAMTDMLPLFVLLSDNDSGWTAERLRPLAEYVYSLRAPANPSPPTRMRSREEKRCSPSWDATAATTVRTAAAYASSASTKLAPIAASKAISTQTWMVSPSRLTWRPTGSPTASRVRASADSGPSTCSCTTAPSRLWKPCSASRASARRSPRRPSRTAATPSAAMPMMPTAKHSSPTCAACDWSRPHLISTSYTLFFLPTS